MQDVIRMTYDVALCHPNEITKIWSLSHPDDLAIPSISSGWLIVDAYVIRMTYLALVSHPDELRQIHYVIRMTYSSILCHPDYLTEVGFSSGWVTAMLLCHPDEIAYTVQLASSVSPLWMYTSNHHMLSFPQQQTMIIHIKHITQH